MHKAFTMIHTNKNQRLTTPFAAAAVLGVLLSFAPAAEAALVNFSSVEVALSDPDNYNAMHYAAWAGWATQRYEYNMPFIELEVTELDPAPITRFEMTIGDTDYNFANEFKNKHLTNSWDIPANGEYALLGNSTPGIGFTSSVEDNGDKLVLEFGNGGLQVGQVVRFQVDINTDEGVPGTQFAPYTSVFFMLNGGDDDSGNSLVRVEYADDSFAETLLPNHEIDKDLDLMTPRPYSEMQMIPIFPNVPIDEIPEPTGLVLAALGAGLFARRRG